MLTAYTFRARDPDMMAMKIIVADSEDRAREILGEQWQEELRAEQEQDSSIGDSHPVNGWETQATSLDKEGILFQGGIHWLPGDSP